MRVNSLIVPVVCGVIMAVFTGRAAAADSTPRYMMGPTRAVVRAPNAMVATSHPLAVQAGLEILKKGGNAIDAAIAANAVIGLTEPASCGVGGDLFVIYWDNATQKLYGLNASGRSPYGISVEKVHERGHELIPVKDPLAWSVPGCVDGWDMLRRRFGTMTFEELLAPAIRYAEKGFPVSGWPVHDTVDTRHREFRDTYLPGGKALKDGDVFTNPGLARTYRTIAEKGRDAFYRGEIAGKINTSIT